MSELDIKEILDLLPHRYPFLLVDKVLSVDEKSLKAVKNVTANEPYFTGHFPGDPVMPGVMIVEALAQATGILNMLVTGNRVGEGSLYYLVGIDNARFKRRVVPGDQLILNVEQIRSRSNIHKFSATATVDGEVACSVDITGAYKGVKVD